MTSRNVPTVLVYDQNASTQIHRRLTDHGGVGGLVAGAHQRPASLRTLEDGVLGEQLAGRAGAERLHRRAGAAGQLAGVLLRHPVQRHEDAAQGRVGASCNETRDISETPWTRRSKHARPAGIN